ncbi:hypothetical protein TNCV_1847811 [Trichonephila clavipes]|nr:hypothetical protein TNCV_1847811 [Trichonephila clavipes]
MLVRLSRAPVLSGGLRRKTQLFSPVPSTWPLPPRPHFTCPKVFKSSKPRFQCQVSQEAVRCVIIPIVKTHQTQLHSTQSCAFAARGYSRAASPLVRLVAGDEWWEAPAPSSKLEWNSAKSYCHLYGAQGYGQRQAASSPLL